MQTQNAERRHPMQVFVAGLLTLSGIPILAGGPQPGSLSSALPDPLVYLWAVVLVAGGAMVVTAALVRSPETALYFEFAAEPPLALVLSAYAIGALVAAGLQAVVAVALSLGLAAAFTVRAVTVYRKIRGLRAALEGRK